MRSLKSKLIYEMVGGMILLLIGFDLIIYHIINRAMFNQFDASLESAAHIISASVEGDNDKLDLEIDSALIPEFVGDTKSAYYELWEIDGTPIRKSPSLGDDELIWFSPAQQPLIF
jgi:hypothetical protein